MTVTLHSPTASATRVALLGLATARLTRFITSDWLGEWVLVGPAKRWAAGHTRDRLRELRPEISDRAIDELGVDDLVKTGATDDRVASKAARLVKGLECPFCVGFWLGGAVLVGDALLGPTSKAPLPLRLAWKLGIGALALNYVVAHISSKID